MRNIDLLAVFIVSSVLNLTLFGLITYLTIRMIKIRQNEFYLIFISTYLCLALLTRIGNYIYELAVFPEEEFNRRTVEDYSDVYGKYFYHLPMMFFALASVCFLFRWLDFYYSTPEVMNYDTERSK